MEGQGHGVTVSFLGPPPTRGAGPSPGVGLGRAVSVRPGAEEEAAAAAAPRRHQSQARAGGAVCGFQQNFCSASPSVSQNFTPFAPLPSPSPTAVLAPSHHSSREVQDEEVTRTGPQGGSRNATKRRARETLGGPSSGATGRGGRTAACSAGGRPCALGGGPGTQGGPRRLRIPGGRSPLVGRGGPGPGPLCGAARAPPPSLLHQLRWAMASWGRAWCGLPQGCGV